MSQAAFLILWLAAAGLVVLWFRGARRGSDALDPAPRPGSTFMLGGRRFRRPLHTSIAQDDHLVGMLRAAGMDEPNPLPGEAPDAYAERIFGELHARRALYGLLASILVPADAEKWSPEVAAGTAAFLPTLEEPADKERYYALLGEILLPFCTSGASSLLRSATSGSPSPGPSPGAGASSPASATASGRS